MVRISAVEGIVPIEEAAADLGRVVRLAASGEAVVITDSGRAVAVILSPEEFDGLQAAFRRNTGVLAGMADVLDGRLVDGAQVEAWLATWGTAEETEAPRPPTP